MRAGKRWSRVAQREAPAHSIVDILRARLEGSPMPVGKMISAGAREVADRLRVRLCAAEKHGSRYPNCPDCANCLT